MVIEVISKRDCFALLVHTSLATKDLIHLFVDPADLGDDVGGEDGADPLSEKTPRK